MPVHYRAEAESPTRVWDIEDEKSGMLVQQLSASPASERSAALCGGLFARTGGIQEPGGGS
jgi:hypothetical protein